MCLLQTLSDLPGFQAKICGPVMKTHTWFLNFDKDLRPPYPQHGKAIGRAGPQCMSGSQSSRIKSHLN
jgi:hypothetical protein